MTTVISIVSGKGGAGKSLLTAVLGRAIAREGVRVLLVDTDIFVRGLTILLSGFSGLERGSAGYTISDMLGVYDRESGHRPPRPVPKGGLLVQRFFECDIVPAVDNISAPLDYDEKNLSEEDFCNRRIKALLANVAKNYDYVLLDNRAGMDSLIGACCRNSDVVLSISEDDEVGRQTNANLVSFLQQRKFARVVYTILNKGRHIYAYSDIERRFRQRSEFSVLGVVPFDIDILEGFGTDRFWTEVNRTLYFRAIIDCWNNLAKQEKLVEIPLSRYEFPPRIFMTKSAGRFTLVERMLRVYGVMISISGLFFWLYSYYIYPIIYARDEWTSQSDYIRQWKLLQASAAGLILLGCLGLVISTSGFQNFLRGPERRVRLID